MESVVHGRWSTWDRTRARFVNGRSPWSVSHVESGVYLGGAPVSDADVATLRALRIRSVVTLLMPHEACADPRAYGATHVLRLPTPDGATPTDEQLRAAARFVRQSRARGNVFVHCKSGVGRSAACVVAHVAASRAVHLSTAFAIVRTRRPQIRWKRRYSQPFCASLTRVAPLQSAAFRL